MLAAYIDQRLPPDARAAVEAQLATDPDTYELLVELIHAKEALKDAAPAAEPADAAEGRPEEQATVVPLVPKPARTRTWAIAGGVLAAAAALVLVVRLQPDLLPWSRGGAGVDPQLAKLVAAVGEERYIEARLTGGFKYGPLRSATRGAASTQDLALLSAAAELQARASSNPSAANLRSAAAAHLMLANDDEAVAMLEQAAAKAPADAAVLADLSAAYLTRAERRSRPEDVPLALAAADRAIAADAGALEALFNRALALQRLRRDAEAREAWLNYAARDRSAWGDDARRRSVAQ
jgi:hypothetical protein